MINSDISGFLKKTTILWSFRKKIRFYWKIHADFLRKKFHIKIRRINIFKVFIWKSCIWQFKVWTSNYSLYFLMRRMICSMKFFSSAVWMICSRVDALMRFLSFEKWPLMWLKTRSIAELDDGIWMTWKVF